MPFCALCGKVVLFRWAHTACERELQEARRLFHDLTRDSIISSKDLDLTRRQLEHLARARNIPEGECDALLAEGWDAALDHCLADGLFTPAEMTRMREASFRLGVSTAHLEARGVPGKLEAFKRRAEQRDGRRPQPPPQARTPTPRPAAHPVGKKGKPVPYGRDWDKWLDEEARWRQNAKHGKFRPAGEEKEPDMR